MFGVGAGGSSQNREKSVIKLHLFCPPAQQQPAKGAKQNFFQFWSPGTYQKIKKNPWRKRLSPPEKKFLAPGPQGSLKPQNHCPKAKRSPGCVFFGPC